MSHVNKSPSAGFGIEIGLIYVVGEDAADGDIFCRTGRCDRHEDKQ